MGETITVRVLRMIFLLEDSKTMQWNLTNPKDGVTKQEVRAMMDEMIEDQFILSNEKEATEIKDAYIYETNKIDLA